MNYIALFFIFIKMFHFINAMEIAFFVQSLTRLIREQRKSNKVKKVVIIDNHTFIYFMYLIGDFLFLIYGIWLIFDDVLWQEGCMLLIISALEAYAVRARIIGTYAMDSHGFVYPRMWFRYLMFGMSMFILLRLFEGQ